MLIWCLASFQISLSSIQEWLDIASCYWSVIFTILITSSRNWWSSCWSFEFASSWRCSSSWVWWFVRLSSQFIISIWFTEACIVINITRLISLFKSMGMVVFCECTSSYTTLILMVSRCRLGWPRLRHMSWIWILSLGKIVVCNSFPSSFILNPLFPINFFFVVILVRQLVMINLRFSVISVFLKFMNIKLFRKSSFSLFVVFHCILML